MWPGIAHIESSKGFTEFDQGQMVIIYAFNGYTTTQAEQEADEEKKESEVAADDEKPKETKIPVYIPVATGKMIKEGEIPEVDAETGRQKLSRKGKAVEIEHFLFDELWNSGDKKMPTGVEME